MNAETYIEDVLRQLIEVDTSNPPGRNYGKMCKLIAEWLRPLGCEVRLIRAPAKRVSMLSKEAENISGERINLVAALRRGEGKTLILNGHMDTVPAAGYWTHPPLKLSRDGDFWYGRGVADMKGALAGMVSVFNSLATDNSWRGTLILEAVCDEEIGGYTGAAYLHDADLVRGDYCIVGDGSFLHVTNAANGCLRFRVMLRGRSVHSSMNWRGINAVEKASHLIVKVEEYNKSLLRRRSKVPANPETGVDYVTPSITVGTIHGGTKVNIVPDLCVLEIDRRVSPEEDKAEAVEEFRNILDTMKAEDEAFNYELTIGGFHDSFVTPEHMEPIPTLREAYRQVTGRLCPVYGGLGCYDAAHIAKHGIPVAVIGVSRVDSNVHGVDERVMVKDVLEFTEVIKLTALKLLR